MIVFRSSLFALALVILTPPYAVLSLCTFPLPPLARYHFISGWSRIVILLSRVILGIRHRVEGLENLPKQSAVILSKHQSAWETIAFQIILPPHVQVLKRELLWIPFFGWGLALMSPIAIDRSKGATALKRMAEQGRRRLAQGFWILIYPEGTRMPPGKRGKYRVGGAWVAEKSGVPVVPVAHNAGLVWPRNAFLKKPGLITVVIGKPIETAGLDAAAINARAEAWIEERMETLCPK